MTKKKSEWNDEDRQKVEAREYEILETHKESHTHRIVGQYDRKRFSHWEIFASIYIIASQ